MITLANKIDTTGLTLASVATFPSRTKAKNFMNEDKATRVFRDMNNATAIRMGQRWQVMNYITTPEVSTKAEVAPVVVEATPEAAPVAPTAPVVVEATPEVSTKAEVVLRKGTKAEEVREIVANMIGQEGIRTKDVIAEIMTKVGFKQRAASTYFYNAKKALGL